jgi:hypothetical protein
MALLPCVIALWLRRSISFPTPPPLSGAPFFPSSCCTHSTPPPLCTPRPPHLADVHCTLVGEVVEHIVCRHRCCAALLVAKHQVDPGVQGGTDRGRLQGSPVATAAHRVCVWVVPAHTDGIQATGPHWQCTTHCITHGDVLHTVCCRDAHHNSW